VSFFLGTSVISKLVKPTPDDNVVEWMSRAEETSLDLSVLTIGEVEKGIRQIPHEQCGRCIQRVVDRLDALRRET